MPYYILTTNYYQGVEGTTNDDYTLNSQPTGIIWIWGGINAYEVTTPSCSMTFSRDQGINNSNIYGAPQDIITSNVKSIYVTPSQNYSYIYS